MLASRLPGSAPEVDRLAPTTTAGVTRASAHGGRLREEVAETILDLRNELGGDRFLGQVSTQLQSEPTTTNVTACGATGRPAELSR